MIQQVQRPREDARVRRGRWPGRWRGVLQAGLAGVVLAAAAALPAQETAPDLPPGTPRVSIRAMHHVLNVRDWPGVTLTVSADAHVAVFVVTRGRSSYPVELLAPATPRQRRRVRAGRVVPLRPMRAEQLEHLVSGGDAPLLIAFASTTPAQLAAFEDRGAWARNLVLDTLVADQRALVDELGKAIYPAGTPFTVVTATVSQPLALTADARRWFFSDECAGYAAQLASLPGGVGRLPAPRPGAVMWMWGAAPTVFGQVMWGDWPAPGRQVMWVGEPLRVGEGCLTQQVAWVPVGWAGASPATAGGVPSGGLLMPTAGVAPDTLTLRLPRLPGADERLTIGDAAPGRGAGGTLFVPPGARDPLPDDGGARYQPPTPGGQAGRILPSDPDARGDAPPRWRREEEPVTRLPIGGGDGGTGGRGETGGGGRGETGGQVERERRPVDPPPPPAPPPPPPPPPPPAEPPPPVKPPVPPG